MNRTFKKINVVLSFALLQFFFFQSSTAHAQLDVEYEWVAQMWGASTVQVYDIALDGDENVYAIGRFNVSSGYFDNDNLFTPTIPRPGSNNSVFIVKYDKDRNFQWARAAGGAQYDEGYSIHVDASNNVYATGVFNGTVSFGSYTLTSKNTGSGTVRGDAFVVKLNSSGTFLWAKSFGGTGTVMYSHSITTDPSGNIYLTGYFAGGHVMNFSTSGGTRNVTGAGSGRSNAYVLKLDNNGNDLWVNTYGASSSDVMGRAVVADGSNIYVMGYFNGTVDFKSTGSYPQASSVLGSGGANHLGSYFVLRISQSLGMASAPIVISRSGASGWSYGRTLALSGSNLYVTGEQGNNAFVAKYNASLVNQWMKTFGATARGNGIAVDGDGNVYTTGYFTGASFSPGGGGASLSKKGTRDAYLHVLDGNGDFLTAKQFGGSGAEVTGMGIKVAPSSSKAIYIGGYFGGYNKTTDFDPNAGIANVNPLSSSSDGFIVKLNPMTCTTPSAPTAANQSFCASENARISDLAVSGETGATFTWYNVSTGGTALPSGTALTNGTYYVSQTVDGCESPRTAVTVTITNPAAPTAVDQSFCASENARISDLAVSGETGATFTWYNASTGGTALSSGTALTNGTYYVSQTVGGCESTTRTAVTVTLTSVPAAPTAVDQSFCDSDAPTVADLIASGETGATFTWYDASTGGTALSSGTALVNGTTYYASQTIGCESTRTGVTVTINPVPAAPTTEPLDLCGEPTVADLVAKGEVGATFKWYANATGGTELANSVDLSNGATYYATQTVDGCESNRASVGVLISTKPAAPTTNTPQSFCGSATVDSLVATGTNIQWYDVATGGTALTSGTALTHGSSYFVSSTDNGCESDRIAVVASILSLPSAPTASAQSLCGSATVADLLPAGAGYTWYDASTGGTALASTEVLTTSTYYISQTNSNGCEGPRTAVSVTNNNVTHIDTRTECNPFTWIDGNVYTADNNTATYTFVGGAASGCDSIVTLDLTISGSGPTVSIDNVQNVDCFGGNNGSAEAVAVGGAMPYTYAWSPTGGTNAVANNLTAGNYIVEVTDDAGCVNSAQVTITSPAAIGIDTVIVVAANCGINDGSIAITPNGGTPNYQYSWENGETSSTLSNSSAGSYNVTITDDLGCSLDTAFTIPVTGDLTVGITPTQTTIESGETVELTVNIGSEVTNATYTWTPADGLSCTNCPNPEASPNSPTTYYVTVETPDGCSSTASVQIEVTESCTDLFIPNMFSPNSDGENDSFCVYGSCMSSFEISIYNRWGELIFNSEDQNECWDGTYKGKKMNTDVFVYKMKATTHKGEVIEKSGNINLIR